MFFPLICPFSCKFFSLLKLIIHNRLDIDLLVSSTSYMMVVIMILLLGLLMALACCCCFYLLHTDKESFFITLSDHSFPANCSLYTHNSGLVWRFRLIKSQNFCHG
ncbi:hypothetical protein ERO13_A11G098566v2 [Gossypium hirsutum]|nr:hypothetical protein ERO13_A11G098566v2 [Gossypium hirsutum]